LGAAFSALAVLQIQQSHFFTVDTIANLFIFLTINILPWRSCCIGLPLLPAATFHPIKIKKSMKVRLLKLDFANSVLRFISDPFSC